MPFGQRISIYGWAVGALRDFTRVWKLMTPENQGRLLRALVAAGRVKEETGVVECG